MTVKGNVVGGAMIISGGQLQPVIADKGDKGDTGAPSTVPGPSGSEGNDGWTPVFAGVLDGTRTVIRVVDWTGGEGTKPATGQYIGPAGYVSTVAAAFNFNAAKRVRVFSGLTNASTGIATIDYSSLALTAVPQLIPLPPTLVALSGPTRTTVQTSPAPTTSSYQVKVEQQALLTAIVSVLGGVTANVLVIES